MARKPKSAQDPLFALITDMEKKAKPIHKYFKEGGCDKAKTSTLLQAYIRLADVLDALDEVVGVVKGAKNFAKEVVIPRRFEAEGITSVAIDGKRVTVSDQIRARIKAGMKEEALAFLKKKKQKALIQETVNASTLSAYARVLAEENKELPDDLFDTQIFFNTSITAIKPK